MGRSWEAGVDTYTLLTLCIKKGFYFIGLGLLYYAENRRNSSADKESACNARDLGFIPGLGRSPGEEKGYPLQYSGLGNSMDCIVHGVAKSRTRLSN